MSLFSGYYPSKRVGELMQKIWDFEWSPENTFLFESIKKSKNDLIWFLNVVFFSLSKTKVFRVVPQILMTDNTPGANSLQIIKMSRFDLLDETMKISLKSLV